MHRTYVDVHDLIASPCKLLAKNWDFLFKNFIFSNSNHSSSSRKHQIHIRKNGMCIAKLITPFITQLGEHLVDKSDSFELLFFLEISSNFDWFLLLVGDYCLNITVFFSECFSLVNWLINLLYKMRNPSSKKDWKNSKVLYKKAVKNNKIT